LEEVTALVIRLGGTTSGEHGDGRLRAPAVEQLFGPHVCSLFRAVKDAFDPRGILNPGIKLGTAPAVARLKVGNGAVELPDGIASGLREIERRAGYATPRLSLIP